MKTRSAIAAAAVVSLAACAQTPTAPAAAQVTAAPSFNGGIIGSGSFVEDGAESFSTAVAGDTTGRNPFALGSGS